MAEWKKVIVSGSSAVLSGLTIPEQAAASGDEVLIINSSGVVTSTAQSNIAGAGTTTNALTVDDSTLSLDTGTTFDGSVARTISVKTDGIDSGQIAAGAIDLEHMSVNSVDSDQYVDGSIDLAHLSADSVDGTKIADNAIDSEHYTDGSIDTAHIGNLQVTTAKIAADAIDGTKLADNAVDSEHYTNGSIDNAHIADNAIDSEHYAAASIDTEHIANSQITNALMADDAIDSAEIANGAIDLVHMSVNSIDSDQYVDGSIDAAHLATDIAISTTGNITSTAIISGSTINTSTLNVTGNATMTGSLVFNGVSFTETSVLTSTGSNVFGANGGSNTQTFYGASTFNDGNVTISDTLILGNDLAVEYGGTGAGTFTDGGILLGNGTGAITAMAVLTDGQMIVGDGTTDPVAESGATLRTSIGVGTSNSPQFTAVNFGHASNNTLSSPSAGDLQIESNIIYRAGGTDVAVIDGGTGVGTHTSGQVLIGAGTSAITSTAIGIADNNIVAIDGGSVTSGEYAKFTANGLQSQTFAQVSTDLGLGAAALLGVGTVADTDAGLVTGNAVYDFVTGQGFGQGSGDISSVNAGAGLSGGGLTGDVTMSVGAGTGITVNVDDVAVTAAQTGITSVTNIGLQIGRALNTDYIDFGTDSSIKLKTNNADRLTVTDAGATLVGTLNVTDLNVTGTTTTVNTTNLTIEDAFIALGSGASGTDTDAGIIFGAGSGVEGDALFWDGSYNGNDGRLGIGHGVALASNTATAEYYLAGVTIGNATAAATALADHKGNILIDGSDIYIYV
tara:strand:- start:3711 stop:6080 length:2370 start_codon:yes stop_codon:yes gene_type:complete